MLRCAWAVAAPAADVTRTTAAATERRCMPWSVDAHSSANKADVLPSAQTALGNTHAQRRRARSGALARLRPRARRRATGPGRRHASHLGGAPRRVARQLPL